LLYSSTHLCSTSWWKRGRSCVITLFLVNVGHVVRGRYSWWWRHQFIVACFLTCSGWRITDRTAISPTWRQGTWIGRRSTRITRRRCETRIQWRWRMWRRRRGSCIDVVRQRRGSCYSFETLKLWRRHGTDVVFLRRRRLR